MASYNELLALIDAYINQNGVQAITGQVLNGVLRAMVDQLGRGYSIMGAADPTTDPGTPDGPETWFASVPGTYTNFDGIQIVDGELALLSYVPSTGFSKNTIYEGFQTVQATIDGNVGTPAVGVSYANGILSFDFHNMKGVTGDPAGFGAVTASVDSNIGTPSVQVQTSGPDTAKAIAFQFHNLKGETGVTSVLATVDNTSGNPQCAVSLNGQQLVLNFTGLKGAQGDTGSSVDYPFTIVNNLTTDDATQALSAAQGVVLAGQLSQLDLEVSQLQQEVEELGSKTVTGEMIPSSTEVDQYISSTGDLSTLVDSQVKIFDVEEGDEITLTISGAVGSSIAWAFYSASPIGSATMVSKSGQSKFANGTHNLTIASGVTKFAVTITSDGTYSIVGPTKTDLDTRLNTTESDIADLQEDVSDIQGDVLTLQTDVQNVGTINTTEEMTPDTIVADKYISSDGSLADLSGSSSVYVYEVEEGDEFVLTIANAVGNSIGWAFYNSSTLGSASLVSKSGASKNCNGTHDLTVPTGATHFALTVLTDGTYSTVKPITLTLDDRFNAITDEVDEMQGELKNGLFQYKVENDTIKVAYGYGTVDLIVSFYKKGGNNIFDYGRLDTIVKGGVIDRAAATNILFISTDWHAPFVIAALDNIDGDDVDSHYYTGGNHQYNNLASGSTATGRTTAISFYADGRAVTSGSGYASNIEIRWTNLVQGYNTKKADGTGREILQENHRIFFNGKEFEESVELIALEDLVCETWYGLQYSGRASIYPNTIFVGGPTRTVTTANSSSGASDTPRIIGYGTNDKIEMTVDTTFDLGKRPGYTGNSSAFTSGGNKAYFHILDNITMGEGEHFFLKGSCRFLPV